VPSETPGAHLPMPSEVEQLPTGPGVCAALLAHLYFGAP
jgi:hypothetical protein